MSSRRNRPRVDVGIVTWNTAQLTAGAVRRLIDTDQGCDLRVLVHDNASSDGTVGALAAAAPEADIEAGTTNVGFARAVNSLVARSRAPWFLALNSDAWPEPGAIGTMVEAAEKDPEVAAVAPLLLRPDGTVEHSTHPFPTLGVAALDAVAGRRWLPAALLDRLYLEGSWSQDRTRVVDWAVGAALLFRRSALDAIGGLDERFFMYVEDLEWCWRARSRGWKVLFEPTAVVRHVGNASGGSRFGGARPALEAANLDVFLRSTRSPVVARTFRMLSALASGRLLLEARRKGDAAATAHWRSVMRSHLALDPAPPVDPPESAAVGRHYAARTDIESQSSPGEVRAGLEQWLVATSPDDPVIDVGSGVGANLAMLTKAGHRAVGVEIAATAARHAAALAPVVVADGSALPFRTAAFGAGACTEVLEHVADPGAVFSELARLVRPGGLVYVTTPNYANLAGIHKRWADRRSGRHDWNPWGAHAGGYEAFMTGRALVHHATAHLDVASVRGLDFGQALTGRFSPADRAAASRPGQKLVVPLLRSLYRRAGRWPFRWHGMHVELVLRSRHPG